MKMVSSTKDMPEYWENLERENNELRVENERLRATLEKWRPAVDRAMKWSEQLGNERDAKGFAAMLADFDSALESKP
jgi:hypothetical protein